MSAVTITHSIPHVQAVLRPHAQPAEVAARLMSFRPDCGEHGRFQHRRRGSSPRAAVATALAACAALPVSVADHLPGELIETLSVEVASGTALQAAMEAGEAEIVVTQHLDLSGLSPQMPGSDAMFSSPSQLRILRVCFRWHLDIRLLRECAALVCPALVCDVLCTLDECI